jgi:hypothetical protein
VPHQLDNILFEPHRCSCAASRHFLTPGSAAGDQWRPKLVNFAFSSRLGADRPLGSYGQKRTGGPARHGERQLTIKSTRALTTITVPVLRDKMRAAMQTADESDMPQVRRGMSQRLMRHSHSSVDRVRQQLCGSLALQEKGGT